MLEGIKVINYGVEADSTKGVLTRLDRVFDIEPKLVILMIGINDLCISTPINEVFEDYKKILIRLKEASITTVVNAIFITQMASVNKKVYKFNNKLDSFCKEQGFVFLDLNSSFENEKTLLKEELTIDGLHLGLKAYKVWAYKLKQLIKELNLL